MTTYSEHFGRAATQSSTAATNRVASATANPADSVLIGSNE